MKEFFDAIRAPETRRKYQARLAQFLDYAGAKGDNLSQKARWFTDAARKDYDRTTWTISSFLMEQKTRAEKGEISASTVSNYVKPLKLFCEMNDIVINWKKIGRKLPTGREYANDRAPTKDEIKILIGYPDRRIKPCLFLMVSSGIRIGAWETLSWGDITPIKEGERVKAAKLRVYPGDKEEYYTFISGEAYRAIEEYIQYRALAGERIGANSPVLRDLFHPDRVGRGEPHLPKRLASNGVKRLIEDALKGTGLRGKLPEGKRRFEWQGAHGFRKYFKTQAERHMKTLHSEMLLGHNTGLNKNYYRPTEEDLLDDYLKAMPDLTIIERPDEFVNPDVQVLTAQVADLNKKLELITSELVKRGIIPKSRSLSASSSGKSEKLKGGVGA